VVDVVKCLFVEYGVVVVLFGDIVVEVGFGCILFYCYFLIKVYIL